MSKRPLLDNEFALFATRSANDGTNINYLKITRDWKDYYDIPKDFRSSDLRIYDLIRTGSAHSAFLTYIQEKIKDGLDNNWCRNYRLRLAKEGSIFYDNDLVPRINDCKLILSKDKDKDKTLNEDNEEDCLDLSIEELSKVFGKLCIYCNLIFLICF